MDTRTESRTQAHENIRDEQLQQKCVFDNTRIHIFAYSSVINTRCTHMNGKTIITLF